jgi:hypothetical protein
MAVSWPPISLGKPKSHLKHIYSYRDHHFSSYLKISNLYCLNGVGGLVGHWIALVIYSQDGRVIILDSLRDSTKKGTSILKAS